MKGFNFFFLFFISLTATAQKVGVSARTDRATVPINQLLTLTVSIQYEGDRPEDLEISNLSELTGFNILNKWSGSQSSISIINGRVEKIQSLEYNYKLQAQKKGTLKIRSLDVKINGKIYKTKPIIITVTKEQDQPSPPSSSPRSPFPKSFFDTDPFDSFFNSKNIFSKRPISKRDIKVQVNLNKKTVYEGEAIKANWVLLVSSGNVHYDVNKSPKLKGFWKESITLNPQNQFLGTSIVNNILYRKTLLDSMVLFPLRSGKLTIDPYSLRINSVFGFGGGRSEIKNSPKRVITVKPLPLEGKKFFSGAVGTFQVTASLEGTKTKVNEPLAYRIKFEGDGHPQFIKLPKIPFPSNVKTYAPVEKSKFNLNGKSFKNYEIILIPKVQGEIVIPSFQISTFDPQQATYIYHQIPSFKIQVLKGDQVSEKGLHFFNDEKQTKELESPSKPLQLMTWPFFLNHKLLMPFWKLFYICVALVFLLLIFWPLGRKQKTVREKLRRGLKEVEDLINDKKWKPSSVKLISLVYLVLYQFDTQNTSTDWLELVEKLPPTLYKKHSASLISLMKHLERLSFAPRQLSDGEALAQVKVLHQKAMNLLVQLLD